MLLLRAIRSVVFFLSIVPALMGLLLLSGLVAPWGPEVQKYFVVGGGIALLIAWSALMSWSVARTNEAFRQREIDRANLSAVWQRNSARPLEVDLTKLTLARVPLGGDLQGLSFLGPAEDAEDAPEGRLHYGSRGLTLDMENGRFTGFGITVDVFLQASGAAILAAGMGPKLNPDTSEAELIAVMGAPFWRMQDEEGEVDLFYERFVGERWVELKLGFVAGRLKFIDVCDTPMFAEESVRKRHGITVGWPPEGAVRKVS